MELLSQGIDPNQTDWSQFLRDFGFPITVAMLLMFFLLSSILAIGGTVWVIIWRTGAWIAPIIERGAAKHNDLVDTLQVNSVKQVEINDKTADTLETLTQSQIAAQMDRERTTGALQEIVGTQKKIVEDLTKQTDLQQKLHDKVDKIPSLLINVNDPNAQTVDMQDNTGRVEQRRDQ
jgi:hypothetical protein